VKRLRLKRTGMLVIGDSWWLSGCNGFEYRPTVRVVSGSINRGVDAMIEAEGFEQSIVKEIFHFFRKCNFERAPGKQHMIFLQRHFYKRNIT
jgi:hypothetical protein